MKIGCNGFYAFKIAYFNMLYKTVDKHCQSTHSTMDVDKTYQKTLAMMLRNNWINPMHTNVPGPDGYFGSGGACFPKDSNALNQHVKRMGVHNAALQGAVDLNLTLRDDVPY
jgi:UDPglucose 6-dehydrogenase